MAVKFFKIDLFRVKKLWYFLLLPLICFFLIAKSNGMPALFGLGYCLFLGVVFSTFPANFESRGERGFLQMLPSRPGADIKGHFLFAAVCILFFSASSAVVIFISKHINPGLSVFRISGMDVAGFYPVLIGVALLFSGIELLLLTIFRYKSSQVQQLFRIIPAFVFFYAMSNISDRAVALTLPGMSFGIDTGCLVLTAACIVIYILLAEICSKITAGKEA